MLESNECYVSLAMFSFLLCLDYYYEVSKERFLFPSPKTKLRTHGRKSRQAPGCKEIMESILINFL